MQKILSQISDLLVYDSQSPMLFNSGTFFLLFILFIATYALIKKHRWTVTVFVILFSVFFYYKSSGFYLIILVFTSITDYSFAIATERANKKFWKKFWVFLAVTSSLGILAFFKYTNFFFENFTNILKYLGNFPVITEFIHSQKPPIQKTFTEIIQNNFQPFDIFLPIGISFYTFQSISYVIDVYRKKLPATQNFLDYAFFLSFFPQLVAGPIVKAHHFLPQLRKKITIKKEHVWLGFWLIIIGLFKKAVIADYIAQYNDIIFAAPHTKSGFENLMAVPGYAIQIYGDFSGYSDMAIGLGLLMGFDLGINFNFPYKALNITDFWRRWHISLSSWLRDYLYIPLGGNRKGRFKMYRNLFITMFLGGLWHGASWKFVVWGSAHGMGLAVHKALSPLLGKIKDTIPVKFVSWSLTFIFVITLWIFFRAADIPENYQKITVKNASEYSYTSAVLNQTDSTKNVQIVFFDSEEVAQDTVYTTLKYKLGSKIRVTDEIKGSDKIVTAKVMINAYKVALIMIKRIVTDLNISKYFYTFWKTHMAWVVLLVTGYLMHANPVRWTDKLIQVFIKSPYLVKLLTFLIVLQLVIQFKSEDVVPFIYFQF
ncbi:MAG: MBOAT family O-acyltransferase [Bacteroidota bacterium]|nr:MBOAT family O-acyltransferase [Bacteroidota bacterium]